MQFDVDALVSDSQGRVPRALAAYYVRLVSFSFRSPFMKFIRPHSHSFLSLFLVWVPRWLQRVVPGTQACTE